MNKDDLSNLHNNLLIIMREIDRICKAHNIRYSLHSGSLLGAVRHGGFIPWDDDMDIAMMREDYDRFFRICKTELNSGFDTITIEKDPDYYYGMGKVVMNGTKVRQLCLGKRNDVERLWIDVFPYDFIPSSKLKRRFQAMNAQLCIKMLEERIDGIPNSAGFAKRAYFLFLHMTNLLVRETRIKTRLMKIMRKYDDCRNNEICCICGFGYTRQILPNRFFEELRDYTFEGMSLRGFQNADRYLKQVFGNYMVLPPEEKRETHNLEIIELLHE